MQHIHNIPDELKPLKKWVVWRLEDRQNKKGEWKQTKVPYKSMIAGAATTRKDEWKTFNEAVDMFEDCKDLPKWSRGCRLEDVGFNGIGFVFTDEDEYMGIDWDHIRDKETGGIEAQYRDEIKALDTYVEVSQSGEGAHAILKGAMPGNRHRKINTPYEMYESGRFFVMTGNHLEGTPREIRESPKEAIQAIYEKIDSPKVDQKSIAAQVRTQSLEDKAILELCQAARNADKFNNLYAGEIGYYGGDHSAADLALCTLLAFYTQDAAQIKRIFEGSGLSRDKWDRKDYRDRTIETAIIGLSEIYSPNGKMEQEDKSEISISALIDKIKTLDIPVELVDRKRVIDQFIRVHCNSMPFGDLETFITDTIKREFDIPSKKDLDSIVKKYRDIEKDKQRRIKAYQKNKKNISNKNEKGVFFDTDQFGNCSLNFIEVSKMLGNKHNVIGYNGSIYAYSDGVYSEGLELIKTEIANLSKCAGCNGGVRMPATEIVFYLTYDNPEKEYPFNRYHNMIPVKNGIVVIDFDNGTFELIPHSPEYKFNYKFDIEYKKPENPNNKGVIDGVFNSWVDAHDVDILYQIPAQAILQGLGSSPFKKAYLLQGDPHAAKSGYLEGLSQTFGEDSLSHVPLQTLSGDRFALANLEGKTFNTYDDLSNIPLKDGGVFKTLTGGHKHEVQRKGVQGYSATITAVHVYTCNTPPQFDQSVQHDTAFWERWEYIRFINSFEVDPYFYEKTFTKENLERFFYNILEYVVSVRNDGLKINSTASEVREKWSYSADPLYMYIDANLEASERTMHIDKDKLQESYQMWCVANDIDSQKIITSKTSFTQAIDKYGVFATRVIDSNGLRVSCYEMLYKWNKETTHAEKRIMLKTEQNTF